MSGSVGSMLGERERPDPDAHRRIRPSTLRVMAILSGVVLLGAFVSVTFRITDVAGGVPWLLLVVSTALLAGTVAHRTISVRTAFGVGAALLTAGIAVYFAFVPKVFFGLFSAEFVFDFLSYLTGKTVLQFVRVDLWAVVVTPAPVFVVWYLLLARRYDVGAVVGGLALGFFVLTGDADTATTLAGTLGLFGVLTFGTLECAEGTWDQLEQFALVALLGLVAARVFASPTRAARGGRGGGSGQSLETSLLDNDENVQVQGSISLSPEVRFSVRADRGALWRVGAHDRYTGNSWIRTGGSEGYAGPLEDPVGESQRLVQTYEFRNPASVLPAAWKAVELTGSVADSARVTALGGLRPPGEVAKGTEYTVESRLPDRSVDRLREAGTDYPDGIVERYTRVPDSLPERVGNTATEITADADGPYGAAAAIQAWLAANKDYSLQIDRPDGDIVDGFLFDMGKGYCVYFASAMAVMLRTLDIPARFVTGYTTGESIDEGEWLVRGYNSHTWVEVFFPGAGWIPFDPTPSTARRSAQQRSLERARAAGATNVDVPESAPTATPTPTATPPSETDEGGTVDGQQGVRRTEGIPITTNPAGGAPVEGTPGFRESPGAAGTQDGVGDDSSGGNVTSLVDGIAGFAAERDRVTVVSSIAALVLGVHHFGVVDRVSRELWLRNQDPTGSPEADVARAFDRVEYLLARRYRDREPEETPRQYLESIDVSDRRIRRLAAIYEQSHYGGEITATQAEEAVDLADEIIGE
ncbi:MAG: DUF3488 and DUF4129 domain-containing transglutaminase family protein [Halobacteriales archaeon]